MVFALGGMCVEDGLYNDYRGYDIMIHEVGAFPWKALFYFLFAVMISLRFRILPSSFPSSLGCSV